MNGKTQAAPDPHAVAIARAMQAETDGLVILFGSRAKGNYETASDMDILLIGHTRGKPQGAAQEYMDKNPPKLHVEVMEMSADRFGRERLANQSIVSKASRHGVWMSDETLNHRTSYEDRYPEHWPATRVHLANSWENMHRLEGQVEERSWDDKMVGFTAQQTVENGLKSLLSLHQDTAEFRHDLQRIWNHYLIHHHDPLREGHREIREVAEELMDHTSYESPQKPGGKDSWLTLCAAVYRYGQKTRRMPEWERQEMLVRVREAFTTVMDHVSQESGTSEDDIFPDGKPWERPRQKNNEADWETPEKPLTRLLKGFTPLANQKPSARKQPGVSYRRWKPLPRQAASLRPTTFATPSNFAIVSYGVQLSGRLARSAESEEVAGYEHRIGHLSAGNPDHPAGESLFLPYLGSGNHRGDKVTHIPGKLSQ